jgi:hypothetical protein
MFEKSEERKEMLKELNAILKQKAKFTAFCDGVFNYEVIIDSIKYCFAIISDDDFISEMEVEWLLDLKNVKYFENSIWLLDVNHGWHIAGSKTYNP